MAAPYFDDAPPLPKKPTAVFRHPYGFDLYDGLAMDKHAVAYAEPLLKELYELRQSLGYYQRRCELLQQWQGGMRDPERVLVCDILANGSVLSSGAGDRYGDMTPVEQCGGGERVDGE